jgi:hypothetical protein
VRPIQARGGLEFLGIGSPTIPADSRHLPLSPLRFQAPKKSFEPFSGGAVPQVLQFPTAENDHVT